jgi:hypothetical protein
MAHLYFAFDVGFSINLEETVRRITVGAAQPPVYSRPRTNKYLKLTPSPVRISQAFPEHPVFSSFKTQPQAEALVFEFGAISVALRVPFSGSLPHVTQFIQSIYANESLKQYARSFLDQILKDISPAITKMSVSPQVEDYFVFQIINCEPVMETEDLIAQHSGTIACMLRGETAPLAEEEIESSVLWEMGCLFHRLGQRDRFRSRGQGYLHGLGAYQCRSFGILLFEPKYQPGVE